MHERPVHSNLIADRLGKTMLIRFSLLLSLFALGCSNSEEPQTESSAAVQPTVALEDLLPLRTFDETLAEAKSANQLTVIDLWATW